MAEDATLFRPSTHPCVTLSSESDDAADQSGKRGWLGVVIKDVNAENAETSAFKGRSGALVVEVTETSPALIAGIARYDIVTEADIQQVQARVRQRVFRWFARHGYLDRDDAKEMAQWGNGGGFSVDASVRIKGHDRAGLERLLRYCARPPFALDRLEALDEQRFITEVPRP